MKRLFARLILFLVLCLSPVGAQDMNVYELQDRTGAVFRWDPFRQHGLLVKGMRSVSFKPDAPFIVFDFTTMVDVPPVLMKDGVPVFAAEAAERIERLFLPPARTAGTPFITTIILDPGHGGRDSGAVATHRLDGKKVTLEEKHIVLAVSKELARLLRMKYPDKTIRLTREDDSYPSLEERVEMANRVPLRENETVIYISVHVNASPFNKAATGFEVWYLPPEYRRDLVDPAKLEGDMKEILPILNIMLEEAYTVESILLAKSILNGIDGIIVGQSPNRGLKEESWFVVRKARMPSVLIELGFLTNEREAKLLADSSYLMKISQGIYNGISDFVMSFEKTN